MKSTETAGSETRAKLILPFPTSNRPPRERTLGYLQEDGLIQQWNGSVRGALRSNHDPWFETAFAI
jgi:hypothetical protein